MGSFAPGLFALGLERIGGKRGDDRNVSGDDGSRDPSLYTSPAYRLGDQQPGASV